MATTTKVREYLDTAIKDMGPHVEFQVIRPTGGWAVETIVRYTPEQAEREGVLLIQAAQRARDNAAGFARMKAELLAAADASSTLRGDQ